MSPGKLRGKSQVGYPLLKLVMLLVSGSSKKMGEMVLELNSGTLGEYESVLAIEVYRLPFQFDLPPEMVYKSVWTVLSEIGL